jgi:hypothetical protein
MGRVCKMTEKRAALLQSPEYKEYMKNYCKEYRSRPGYKEKKNERRNIQRALLRLEILTVYSGGDPKCARCGFSDVRALDLDHKNGGGNDHRRSKTGDLRRGATYAIYSELRDEGFPEGYRVLCRNCNWITHVERSNGAHHHSS